MTLSLQERCLWVKSKVTMKQLFDEYGIHYQDISLAHQVNCPFHDDIHASARFYPGQNGGSGSFFCWACDMGGDIIWFVKEWHQYDSLLHTLADIETTFGLQRTTDDVVTDFYRARSAFETKKTGGKLVEAQIVLAEVSAAGRLRGTDPSPTETPVLEGILRTLDSFLVTKESWSTFDELFTPSLEYKEAVELSRMWLDSFRSDLLTWQEEKVTQ